MSKFKIGHPNLAKTETLYENTYFLKILNHKKFQKMLGQIDSFLPWNQNLNDAKNLVLIQVQNFSI